MNGSCILFEGKQWTSGSNLYGAEACATFDIRWVGVDVLRLKGCVPGANLYGGGTIALLTHRSPLNTKGDDAADRKIRNLGVGRAVVRISDVDIQWGGEPVLVRSPPDKRAVRPRSDLMGATWRPTLAT